MRSDVVLRGVIPANLIAFDADLEIDERNYRRHLRHIVDTQGVSGITTNGHAAEVATLSPEEQRRSLSITVDEVAGKVPVVCGIFEDGTGKAVRTAKMAESEGADCLLIFPSGIFDYGSQLKPEMIVDHYATIAEATDLPMIAFVYPATSGLHIPTETLVEVCNVIDNVIAIKEWSNDIRVYEDNWRALKALDKEISVFSSFSTALLPSLCVGADGILSGHGSLIADLQVEIFDAVQEGDLRRARRISDKIYPLVKTFYADPFLDGHNRMKVANAMLGRMENAYVRPPMCSIGEKDTEAVRRAILDADLPGSREELLEVR